MIYGAMLLQPDSHITEIPGLKTTHQAAAGVHVYSFVALIPFNEDIQTQFLCVSNRNSKI